MRREHETTPPPRAPTGGVWMSKETEDGKLRKIAVEIMAAIKVCKNIESIEHSDVVSLLGYQTELMGALTRIPEWTAEVEYIYNQRRGVVVDELGDIPATKLKMMLEARLADETRLMTYAYETGRTISKLLESLNVKIPTERRLMPNKQ